MNSIPILNPTPKTRFCESGDSISKHRDLVDAPSFQRACDFAMLEFSAIIAKETADPNTAIVNALRLRGAHEFLSVFRNLSEKSAEQKPASPIINLNHRA